MATLATPDQPTLRGVIPEMKKPSTSESAKLWMATSTAVYHQEVYLDQVTEPDSPAGAPPGIDEPPDNTTIVVVRRAG